MSVSTDSAHPYYSEATDNKLIITLFYSVLTPSVPFYAIRSKALKIHGGVGGPQKSELRYFEQFIQLTNAS